MTQIVNIINSDYIGPSQADSEERRYSVCHITQIVNIINGDYIAPS